MYEAGDAIDITVAFSKTVTVTGTPTLLLETGTTDRTATYRSGSGTDTLTFRYTVRSADFSLDLGYASTTALSLAGGTIQDANGADATLALPAPGAAGSLAHGKALAVGARPVIVSPSGGTVTRDATFTFRARLDAALGSLTLALHRLAPGADGACAARPASLGTAVQELATRFVGPRSLDFSERTEPEGTHCYYAALGETLGPAVFVSAPARITVDATAPTVTGVSSLTPDGSYGMGANIDIAVSFSEPVTVTGTPTLLLETGATDRTARYVSLASTVQARDLLRIANELRIPRVVLVGDAKQLDAVDAGKPFAQLQAAGMKTATMGEIMRQRDPALKEAVEASLAGEIERAFDKLGENVAQVKPDNIAGAVAARWLALSDEARENTGVMAPSHELRREINGHIRERLAREGRLHGPAMIAERLVSKGYTNAEKALAGNYAVGDTVAFHRPYKRLGVEKGDERRVTGVDHKNREVLLEGGEDGTVRWKPGEIGGRKGGTEVYRTEGIELRAGDRIRWTRNDAGLGLVNSRTAEVAEIRDGRVTFRLEDGRKLELGGNDPQLRHLDHAWASTVHAFQGRTVDNVIAAMEARHPHLTTQKSFYVEISRARDRAELVTDDASELKAQLQAVTGERIAALEGIGEMERAAPEKAAETGRTAEGQPERGTGKDREGPASPSKDPEPTVPERGRGAGMDLGL